MRALQDAVVLLARLLLATIFVGGGLAEDRELRRVAGYMAASGVSGRLLPLVILTELGGGLCVLFGLLARYAGVALAGFSLLTALFFHRNFGDGEQVIHFMKNLAMAGGFLLLAAFGAGGWSLDAWLKGRRSLR